jgi:hypothetical protein
MTYADYRSETTNRIVRTLQIESYADRAKPPPTDRSVRGLQTGSYARHQNHRMETEDGIVCRLTRSSLIFLSGRRPLAVSFVCGPRPWHRLRSESFADYKSDRMLTTDRSATRRIVLGISKHGIVLFTYPAYGNIFVPNPCHLDPSTVKSWTWIIQCEQLSISGHSNQITEGQVFSPFSDAPTGRNPCWPTAD